MLRSMLITGVGLGVEVEAHGLHLGPRRSLVQPLLTSSYSGWGMSSLDQDAGEMLMLTKHLGQSFGSEGIVLIGHSTGDSLGSLPLLLLSCHLLSSRQQQ